MKKFITVLLTTLLLLPVMVLHVNANPIATTVELFRGFQILGDLIPIPDSTTGIDTINTDLIGTFGLIRTLGIADLPLNSMVFDFNDLPGALQFWRQHQSDPLVLIGHSLGADSALSFADFLFTNFHKPVDLTATIDDIPQGFKAEPSCLHCSIRRTLCPLQRVPIPQSLPYLLV